jgi:dephospho-CoA kinase
MSTVVIGLTGPTGAGKSTVSKLFAHNGAVVIDADQIARQVVAGGSQCLVSLVLEFGYEILAADGTLDRAHLGELVFTDKAKLKRLGEITYPYIMEQIEAALERCRRREVPFAVLDAPTLFESGADKLCDYIVTVIASPALRQTRIMARDNLTLQRAEHRMGAQHDDAFYTSRSDFVIENEEDEEYLGMQVQGILRQIETGAVGPAL